MKISTKTRYPHPILSEDTHDYVGGKFKVHFEVNEDPVKNELVLTCNIELVGQEIERLIDSAIAGVGVHVRCGDTYYNEIHEVGLSATIIEFPAGELSGRVVLRPLIWTKTPVRNHISDEFHPEFQHAEFNFDAGTLLAWDREQIVHVGRKKLAPMESIFALAWDDEMSDGSIQVDPASDKIQIHASKRTFTHIHMMRQTAQNQAVLLNGVYLPAVIQLLSFIRSSDEYKDFHWYQIFKAKSDFYGLDLKSEDLLSNAQTLLQLPYLKIQENFRE